MHRGKRQRNASPIPFNPTMPAPPHWRSSQCTFRSEQWISVVLACICAMTVLPFHSEAFSVPVTYHPPTKSSVSNLYHDRSLSKTSASHYNCRPLSQRQAFAGAYASERTSTPAPSSFERRMREMALGAQNKILRKKQMDEQRPLNVHVVESLDDYRRVVGEEKERVVAVRFHASWCRVSHRFG
jgi:hypothetical protein